MVKKQNLFLRYKKYSTGYKYSVLNAHSRKYVRVVTITRYGRSILNMANHFDITVVAECVESLEQFNFLKASQCEIYQWFYFSKLLSGDDFRLFL